MLKIVENMKIWFCISLIVILTGLFFMATKGLELGIDFKGGTDININIGKTFDKSDIDIIAKKYDSEETSNIIGNTTVEIKSSKLTNENITAMFKEIKDKYKLSDSALSQNLIGPAFGQQMANNAIIAIIVANILILIYIAIRFEFKFGVAAIIALIHDVLVTLSVYAVFRIPMDSGFVAAMLTVLGYSMSDTIVVFDRIRENAKFMRKSDVVQLADASITQTISRSLITVLTVLITLVCVFIYVPDIRNFSKPLLIGITSGCYSSIFIATPVWVLLKKFSKKRKAVSVK